MVKEKAKNKRFSVRTKMYIFVIVAVIAVAFGAASIAYYVSASQIDDYYKQAASDNARNFASMVDGDYLRELRAEVESDEFQAIRDEAEKTENDRLIEDRLKQKGLWEKYSQIRSAISAYLDNMKGIKYLYVAAHGDKDAKYDMYLIDDESVELYETGYYEEREKELVGLDISKLEEPTISNGDWGWLCSDFKPVYDSNGECVCIVGCDYDMNEVMKERKNLLIYLIICTVLIIAVVVTVAVLFINKVVVKPLNDMTTEMKKFKPIKNPSYEDAGVIALDIRSRDEIKEIYDGIRSMQINIIDSLNDMSALQKDKQRAEDDIKDKEKQIGQLSIETYKDSLTGVGSNAAYIKKAETLNEQISAGGAEFAIVMADMNDLKKVNDEYGHRSGDMYIIGCCKMMCDAFKRSPVYRIGGDEFVAVLTGADYENRSSICDKLRQDFENSCNRRDVEPWQRYSAAVGMAQYTPEDTNVESVFKRADKAMYEDKSRIKSKYTTS
ncbi:MAG: GGDEF domain-containing protein [Ruminococcus sp.]|nr:GGDEF domain-containing protein [Ruminococcus sp.]